ncbi:MAG: adenosine deaminase [Propionibacteriaceae bacterium]|nr:adenosine deaminase [Micropruina sp.]HBX80086.1 adenosine deaminase [Propionibacteriaceae bacterium]
MSLTLDEIRALPKVALHDHLDGGVRASTVWELSLEIGHPLPASSPEGLADWFYDQANSGSLVSYLETFVHTLAVMQTPENLRRVAREFVLDQAADGVVYAEARWAPTQHLSEGMTLVQAVEAVRDGLDEGMAACVALGRPIEARQILTSMRMDEPSLDIAELVVAYRHDSVCGFDIAGAEDGFPPSRFLEAFTYLRQHNVAYTIHAGEAFGLPSIWEAVQVCGAARLGHGARLVEDLTETPDGVQLGDLARFVRDQRITLELCPTSNLMTGICASYAEHPIDLLFRLGFRTTVSCDNRLMSRTTLSEEFAHLCEAFGYGLPELRAFTLNAAKGAFVDFEVRQALIRDVILPGFAEAATS